MKKKLVAAPSALLSALLASLLFGLVLGNPVRAAEVKAAVAANFTDVTKRLAPLFAEKTGHTLIASFGSSGKLVSQIENGAPFEVFLSADAARPQRLEGNGHALAGTRFTYAVGKLVLWSADPGKVDAAGMVLAGDTFNKVAVANPETAPYGAAAIETLTNLGLIARVRPKLVQGDSISQAFQFVATGNADLGFVALSQVMALEGDKAGSRWLVPQALYAPIAQDAVLLQAGEGSAAARAFLDFLQGPEAKAVIQAFGYETR